MGEHHPQPVAVAVSRWWDDPWARGGWSLLRVGASPATRRALGEPFGRVVIAGEATHPSQAGMVHGAYEQGVAAARWAAGLGARRVAVVGAGAAGAGAARTATEAALDVTVFEARPRIGGRVWSHALAGGVVMELGANWLQQGERNTLAPIAERIGVQLVDTDFHAPLVRGPAPAAAPAGTAAVLDRLRARCAALTSDVPLQTVVDELLRDPLPFTTDEVQAVVDGEIAVDAGAPLSDLSARHGFEPGVGEGDRWVVGGYARLIEHLLEGVDVRLGAPVSRIDHDDVGATVHAGGAAHRFDAAVVTVPSAVLSAGSPVFHPPLPEPQRSALGLLTTGRVEKAVLVFAERWWPASPSGYSRVFGERPGEVSEWLDVTDVLGVPAITGIFVGEWAERLWSSPDDGEVAARVAAVLAGGER